MREFDLADIQGGTLRAYGRQGFPKARYLFLTVHDGQKGRAFIQALRPKITTAARWYDPRHHQPLNNTHRPRVNDAIRAKGVQDYLGELRVELQKPKVAINIAFTFYGLLALETPTRVLRSMPDEFIDGMEKRAPMLGDTPYLASRDRIWRESSGARRVHLMVSLNAEMNSDGTPVAELEAETQWLRGLCANSEGGVEILSGVTSDGEDYQPASAVLRDSGGGVMVPTNKEHFGLSDGFGDPVFEGQLPPAAERIKQIGGGKILPDGGWAPLATGEFLLGYPDEAQEIPSAAMPIEFSRNGTFVAYRKLHENVASFKDYIADQGRRYAKVAGITDPDEARLTVEAKLVGRWDNGVPLENAPTWADRQAFDKRLAELQASGDTAAVAEMGLEYVNFRFKSDPLGVKCPVTSHLRRMNTRDTLDPSPNHTMGSALNNRRRILRRGLPYGTTGAFPTDSGEHGIIFMAVCSSLFRQFEFVQQQWGQYGLDFNAGSDTCPIIGNHGFDPLGANAGAEAKFVIPVDPKGQSTPFICDRMPQFVEPRGGDYFFVPSMTALRMISMGIIDPT